MKLANRVLRILWIAAWIYTGAAFLSYAIWPPNRRPVLYEKDVRAHIAAYCECIEWKPEEQCSGQGSQLHEIYTTYGQGWECQGGE